MDSWKDPDYVRHWVCPVWGCREKFYSPHALSLHTIAAGHQPEPEAQIFASKINTLGGRIEQLERTVRDLQMERDDLKERLDSIKQAVEGL